MRDATRVQITKEQFQELQALLTASAAVPPALARLVKDAEDSLTDEEIKDLIEEARSEYCRNDDLEIDDDAAISRTDFGTWVGAWVWVPNEKTDDEDDDEEDDEDDNEDD